MRALALVATGLVALGARSAAVRAGAGADADPTRARLARVDLVTKAVTKLRGLRARKPIRRDVVDAAALRERLVGRVARKRNAGELAAEARALERWGLLPAGTDYAQQIVDVLAEQVAGFYDPEDRTLYLTERDGDGDAAADDMLLAHEIEHALADQAFDLERLTDIASTEGDALLARRALVEGDGVVVMIEHLLAQQGTVPPWDDPLVASTLEHTLAAATGESRLARAPRALREQLLFPYHAGLAFVAALRRHQPWSAVDAAFARPPRSTEQVLHPDRYAADERPIAVGVGLPRVLAGWDIAHHTVWGEAAMAVFLAEHGVDEAAAATAAAGWGGDRVVLYAPTDRPDAGIGVARTVWDTEADAIEAEEALVRAVDGLVVGAALSGQRWLGLDGRLAWVERVDREVTVVVGAPLPVAAQLRVELAAAMPVKK